jgi:vanillate O-demethylase monooxygenase subunit
MENIEAPPFWAGQINQSLGYKGPVDRWQIIRFEAPCTVNIDVGVAQTGTGAVPEGGNAGDSRTSDRSRGVNGYVLNTITPETDKTCLYFWAFARNYSLAEQRLTHQLREGVATIFREDERVLEAQQHAMDDHPDHKFYNLNIDAGSMWARRLVEGLVAKERPPVPVIPISQAA